MGLWERDKVLKAGVDHRWNGLLPLHTHREIMEEMGLNWAPWKRLDVFIQRWGLAWEEHEHTKGVS